MIPFQIRKHGPFSARDAMIDRCPSSPIVTFFLALALTGTLLGCRSHDTAEVTKSVPIEVPVIQVQPEILTTVVPITGTLVSLAAVDVRAEIAGRVIRFEKMEGDAVRAGETIVWLDRERAELARREAETAVQVADAAVARARILESHNCQELERARNLVSSGGITDRDLKLVQVAESDGHAQVRLALAQLEQAQASLAVAEKHVSDCQVKAPVSGAIQKKWVNPGAYVEAQTVLASLVDNSRLELESPVASTLLAAIKPGQRVGFSVTSYPGADFAGRVREINPAIDNESRAARVRIQVENGSRRLKVGMFAEGKIVTGLDPAAIVIPVAAVYRDDTSAQRAFVYVVENGKAVQRKVLLGQEQKSKAQIVEGLKPGELLISERSIELAQGVTVKTNYYSQGRCP